MPSRHSSCVMALTGSRGCREGAESTFSKSSEKLYEYFQDYRLELALEEITRKTRVAADAATIETIFTN